MSGINSVAGPVTIAVTPQNPGVAQRRIRGTGWQSLVAPPPIAAPLCFDCTPVGELFGVGVNGRRVRFTENVFYAFEAGRIRHVFSVIDKAAVSELTGARAGD